MLVEYRLIEGETAGEWQLLETVNMEPAGHSINIPRPSWSLCMLEYYGIVLHR